MSTADYERMLAALCLWREARGEPDEAKLGVMWVILNRVKSGRYGKGTAGVILRPRQFSSFNPGDPNATRLPMPDGSADWKAFEMCMDIVESPGLVDPTGGATHYHDRSIEPPVWATPDKLTARIGSFLFYQLT